MTEATRWARLSVALDALLDEGPAGRDAALARIAATDPALAADLQRLLEAEAGTGLLEHGIASATPDLLQALADGGDADAGSGAGDRIGAWRVLRELGRGGMGEVLLAERADGAFAQFAALKRLKRGMDSEELLRRFAQERRILAGLSHPHIARLLDGGIDAAGRPWFAMEYVEGEPITAHAAHHALGVRERLQLMQRVCEAVAYAQGRLVVHRDLKPSNLLVDARGEPHLLDFGIAKLLADTGDATLTGTGVRVLSPAYAAPEQLLGQAVSTATDVYALGVLLYELLTGHLPHRRHGLAAEVSSDVLAAETTERPSQVLRRADADTLARTFGARARERDRFAREIQGDLDRIVLTALRREPERRYASAAALADDLRLFLDGRPVAARPDTSGYRLRTFLRRHRVGAAASLLVLLSLLAGLGVALWQADVARRHAREADRQAQRAEAQAARAEQVKAFVVSLFERSNAEQSRRGTQMTAVDLVRDAAQRVEQELGAAPESQAELRVAIGASLVALGAIEDGLAQTEAGVAQLRAVGADPPVLGKALHQLAMHYEIVGRADDAERAVKEALAQLEPHAATHGVEIISARTTLAKLAGIRGDFERMESLYREILAARTALLGPDHPRLAVDWNNLAATALQRDDYRAAADAYGQASRVMAADPEAPESRQAWLRSGRGVALIGLGHYDEAVVELDAALGIAQRTLHAGHPIIGAIRMANSNLARLRGDAARAVDEATLAVALFAALNHPDQGIAEVQLGLAQLAAQHDALARDALVAATTHIAARRNREDPRYWQAEAGLALARLRLGEIDDDADLRAALQRVAADPRRGGVLHAEVVAIAAEAARRLGQHRRARELRAEASAILQARLGAAHPRARIALAAVEAP
jgi:serine/threonine protein kinase/tetratricopeptide (TPR) repeat protein